MTKRICHFPKPTKLGQTPAAEVARQAIMDELENQYGFHFTLDGLVPPRDDYTYTITGPMPPKHHAFHGELPFTGAKLSVDRTRGDQDILTIDGGSTIHQHIIENTATRLAYLNGGRVIPPETELSR